MESKKGTARAVRLAPELSGAIGMELFDAVLGLKGWQAERLLVWLGDYVAGLKRHFPSEFVEEAHAPDVSV